VLLGLLEGDQIRPHGQEGVGGGLNGLGQCGDFLGHVFSRVPHGRLGHVIARALGEEALGFGQQLFQLPPLLAARVDHD